MNVRVSFTVNVDPDAWTMNYGVEGAREIRADVQTYVENGVRQHLSELGLLIETP